MRLERALTIQSRQLRTWWRSPIVKFVSRGGWPLYLKTPRACANTDEQSNPLHTLAGYHWFTDSGQPYAIVCWVRPSDPFDGDNEIMASHELLEMLVNPRITRFIGGTEAEVCDAVSGTWYTIRGVSVSDFVTPAWFAAHSDGPWDQTDDATKPFDVTFGYMP